MPEGADANVGYLVAAAAVTIILLGAYAVSLARRLNGARERRARASALNEEVPSGR